MNYAPPQQSPQCRCRDRGPMASMFCMTGHMTECHHPLDCRQAGCNHLQRYEEETDQAQMAQIEEEAISLLQALADSNCGDCMGTGTLEAHHTVTVPEDFQHLTGEEEVTLTCTAVCGCVARRTAGEQDQ